MRKFMLLTMVIAITLMTTACMKNLQGSSYSRDEARRAQTVRFATVEDVRMVVIEGTASGIGAGAGAIAGGIAGRGIGGGRGSDIASIAGSVAGGVLGAKAEEASTRNQGVEIVLRFEDTDQVIAVVQAHDPKEEFEAGDVVRVMSIGGTLRVAQ